MALLPLDEAQRRLLALIGRLDTETISLSEAHGRWTGGALAAHRSQPAVDLSAMDGYAVRHADLPGPLHVVGESAAGRGFDGGVEAGQAVRIFTGAPIPTGADTVVMQEDCRRDGDALTVTGESSPKGRHIRVRGNDFAEGAVLAAEGQRLTPALVGLLAMGGHGAVSTPRRPRIALISTGDELVPPGTATQPHHIPASNGIMLQAMLRGVGAHVDDFGIIPDDLALIRSAVDRARGHDVIVTIGGASVGDLDLARPALEAEGAVLDFMKVALKPGKPLMAGRLGPALVLGLPGNPVSAFVTAVLFLLPAVRRLMGAASPLPSYTALPCGVDLPSQGGRTEFIRGVLAGGRVKPLENQDSAALAALARADVLIRREAGAQALRCGDPVDVLPID